MKKLAIIGASTGQLPLCMKANEMGLETHCFAWSKGAVCKDVVAHFHPISILEKDAIAAKCRELHIDGVVTNASELTAEVAAYVAEKAGLIGTPYRVLEQLHDKYFVRQLTESVPGLSKPRFYKYAGTDRGIYPCVVKPCGGSAKAGVSFVRDAGAFARAVAYAQDNTRGDIIVEEYIEGKELSVESISFRGRHHVIQVTDKDSSSAPHFVELGHHQPALITPALRQKIEQTIPRLLGAIGYTDGASHIEVKYRGDEVFLIEVNLRGGGDEISNRLVQLSSGVDYLRCMIEVALGTFTQPVQTSEPAYAGIYYLCKQTEDYLPFFKRSRGRAWVVDCSVASEELSESHSNYERDGFLLYRSDHKITPDE